MHEVMDIETGELLFIGSFEDARQWVLDSEYKFVRCCEKPAWVSDNCIAVVIG